MIKTLDRKLLRNLRQMKGQVTAIVLIIACGVAAFVATLTAYRGLTRTRDDYYRRYRMADLFAPTERAPRSVLRDLERTPGVRRVEGRIVFEVTLDLPEMDQPVSGRILSVPDRRRRIINDLHLTRGSWFEGDGNREVIVADRFAKVHGLRVGDRLRVIMNNKKEALRIVATALSPEFVYLIRGTGDIFPDPVHFTVLWLSESFAESVFDFEDACNEVVATLDPDADTDDVIAVFDRRLDRYGAVGAFARADQLSNRYLSDEIKGLRGSATFTPTIFLAVAAFVLHMLMGRLVRTQRTQIAVFRAFGYSTAQLGVHFLKLALLVGVLGAVFGVALGLWFADWALGLYQKFYSFPHLSFDVGPVVIGAGFLVSLGFAALGALGGVRAVAQLTPAVGLRPAAPRIYKRMLLERLSGLWSHLGFVSRMVLRHLARGKTRAAITMGGLSMAASILMLSFFTEDSIGVLIDTQFRLVERHDAQVTFHDERGRAALYDLRRLEGVRHVEPLLIVPAKLVNGRSSRRTGITGLGRGQTLLGLIDRDLRTVLLPRDGLLLSRKLAEILGVDVGESIEVRVLNGKKQRFLVSVENVVDEYLGAFAYADWETLSRWVDEEAVVTGARLSIDTDRSAELGRELKSLPAVAAVSFRTQTVQSFRDTVAASQDVMNTVLILFAGIITFGVIYNTARITLSERARELASMRLLGFTRQEVGSVLSSENLLLALGSLPFGIGLGAFFCWALAWAYETDLYRFPFVLRPETMLMTAVIVIGFTLLANMVVQRRVRRLDLIEVLKARE